MYRYFEHFDMFKVEIRNKTTERLKLSASRKFESLALKKNMSKNTTIFIL